MTNVGDRRVEVDWTKTNTWVDITADADAVSIRRGRPHEQSATSPGTLALTLYNTAGKYTPGLVTGANYPNVKQNRPVRVSIWSGSAWVLIFTGSFDSIVASWDGGRNPIVNATASDGFKGLNRRVSQSVYAETVLDNPALPNLAFYPLSDGQGSTTFGSFNPAAAAGAAQLTSSKYGPGTVTAGNGAGFLPGAPAATYCTFTGTGTGNTEHMTVVQMGGGGVRNGVSLASTGGWTWGCWFNVATAPVDYGELLFAGKSSVSGDPSVISASSFAFIYMDSAGKISFAVQDTQHVAGVISTNGYADGQWHYVTASFATDMQTVSLFIDSTAATAAAPVALHSGLLGTLDWVVAGGRLSTHGQSQHGLNGSLANLEFYSGVDTAAGNGTRWLIGRQGFITTNATSDWFVTIAQNYGFSLGSTVIADQGVTTHMATFDTTGNTYLNALQQAVDTEQGLMYVRGDGALIFRNRAYRVNQASAFALDASHQDIDVNFQVGVDDQLLFNEHAVTRPGGPDIRVRDTTTTSVADNGVYTNAAVGTGNSAKLLLLTTDNELVDYATYVVTQYGNPKPRTSQITVDLKKAPDLWASALALELGVRFTLNNLPAEASAASMDFVAESINWEFSGRTDMARVSMDTSPADTVMYMTLDDNVYGLLDSNSLYY